MKANAMRPALHHVCALRGAINTLTLGFFLWGWAASSLAQGGLFDILRPSDGQTMVCSNTPVKCVEKSVEDLRYERILEALKKMEGGERIYSQMATPANEPASYGPSQMVIEKIIKGLQRKATDPDGKERLIAGEEFTFTAKDGKSYTLTQQHLKDAHNRGKAMFDSGPDLLKEAAKYNDYKDLTMPARTTAADGFLKKSGIPSGEWDTWWQRAVAYQKLIAFAEPLRTEYRDAVVKDAKGKPMTKYDGAYPVMTTFQKFLEDKGNIPST